MFGRAAGRQERRGRIILSGCSSLETPAERALDRVVRSGHPASVLRLYLSRLPSASVQPYHGRVARCLFDDAVQRGGGQVFACKNGDLVLIAGPDPVAALGAMLLRLFRAEAPADQQLIGLWSLPDDEDAVRAEFAASPDAAVPADDAPTPLGTIAAIGILLGSTPFGELVRRQTAVRIDGSRMTALFEELSVSLPAIESRVGVAVPPGADPYLLRYVSSQADARMLTALAGAGLPQGAALHVNLPLASLRTAGFAAFRTALLGAGVSLGVEITLAEATADAALFRNGSDRLRAEGCTVVLDAVGHHALHLCDPAALQPDLLKLEWSPLLPALPVREQRRLRRALDAVGAGRVVLHRAETEAAMVWGLAQGIARFQGRHVDLMLAADRVRACSYSAACSLRQCIDRGAATDEAGQDGCFDRALLGARLHWAAAPAVA